jgi:DNA-binding CsgD family transcriptional regulator
VSWASTPPELRAVIERVCTPRQIEALKWKATGCGARRIGVILGIDESAARGLLRRAERNVQQEIAAQRGIA